MITHNERFSQTRLGLALAARLLMAHAGYAQAPVGGLGSRSGSAGTSPVNTRVLAVADERSNSLIIAASDDMLDAISNLVAQVDQPANDITAVRVFRLVNADPVEMADLLASLFPDETRMNTGNNNHHPQFRRSRRRVLPWPAEPMPAQPSERMKKRVSYPWRTNALHRSRQRCERTDAADRKMIAQLMQPGQETRCSLFAR
jgi:hypothetical protein